MSDIIALARSAAGGNKEDFLTLMTRFDSQLRLLNAATGNNYLAPTNGSQRPSLPPPAAASLSVAAADGVFTLTVQNPKSSMSATLYHEISYSTLKSFTEGVTTLPPSAATSVTVAGPGKEFYFQIRSSYDKANWSSYALAATTPASAGLVSSASTSQGVVLNQSNYATVDSVAAGASANIRVYGAAGPRTMWPGVKGPVENLYPSATIVNAAYNSSAIVAVDRGTFMLAATLPQVFGDDVVPVGKVSVVGSGAITLPTVVPVLSSTGGNIIGYNITNQGNGLTADVTLTISGPGTGATTGSQTISGGKLIAVAAGNPGSGYDGTTTVTASGGVAGGVAGGGTTVGGNGGRLTAV